MFCCGWIIPTNYPHDHHIHHSNPITILPTIPGALGLREVTMVGLFLVVGVPADVVIADSLIDLVVSYLMPTGVGIIATAYYGKLLAKKDRSSSN